VLPRVSVIIVTHNDQKHIKSCLESVLSQDFDSFEVLVVDNCSTDATVKIIEKFFPIVRIIRSNRNLGYSGGNNLGVRYARGEFIVILNPDTVVEKNWLRELVSPLRKLERTITTPKILLYDGSRINTCGNKIHFAGLTFVNGFRENPKNYSNKSYIGAISGCCFCIRKKDYVRLGGFDENFFHYQQDADFSWRALLKNFKILFVPSSIVRHDYVLKVTPNKLYHLEKGRYLILRKYFSKNDFLRFSLSFIMTEFLTFGYAVLFGLTGLKYKMKAIKDALSIKVEKISGNYTNLFRHLDDTIPLGYLTNTRIEFFFEKIANRLFELNYRTVL